MPSRASPALTRSLWSLSLGELSLFQRYLALSSRLVEVEAAHAELEAARLDLWLRRLTLDVTAEPGAEPLEQALRRRRSPARDTGWGVSSS